MNLTGDYTLRSPAELSRIFDEAAASDGIETVKAALVEASAAIGYRDGILAGMRAAQEKHVEAALEGAYVTPPLSTPAELLEFFNRMLDVLLGEAECDEIE